MVIRQESYGYLKLMQLICNSSLYIVLKTQKFCIRFQNLKFLSGLESTSWEDSRNGQEESKNIFIIENGIILKKLSMDEVILLFI